MIEKSHKERSITNQLEHCISKRSSKRGTLLINHRCNIIIKNNGIKKMSVPPCLQL